MSEHEPDTATVDRELSAIDEALASGAATHEDPAARELQELALELRADSPEPDPALAQRLRGRVETGFPKERRRPFLSLPAPVRHTAVGLSAIAAILVPIVLIATLAGSPDSDQSGAGDSGGGGGGASVPPGALSQTRDGFAPGAPNRRIERTVSLELEAPLDELEGVADRVSAVTDRYGGFVLSSSLSTGDESSGGDFELRIPSNRLRPAVRDLSALATVRSQSQTGRDVTREQVTASDRLRAARGERRSLLRRLGLASTDEQAEAIRTRLDLVAGEINGLRGQLRDLRLRTDYAVVSVSLMEADDPGDGQGGAGASFDDALGDAGDLLVGTAGVLIRVLALGLPIGLIALLAWLVGRAIRRRRRESALA